jgi:hypothetical protein
MSKFVYRPMKEQDGRMDVLSTDHCCSNAVVQDGFWQFLFCSRCEQLRSKWETYFSNKLNRGELKGSTNPYRITGLDYDKFKLFLLSTLFAASISDHPFFRKIKLQASSEETLRQMLLTQDPGHPHEFGCTIVAIQIEEGQDEEIVFSPFTVQSNGCSIHIFIFSGFWLTFVEGGNVAQSLAGTFLKRGGSILIHKRKLTEVQFLMNAITDLDRQGKLEPD